MIRNLLLAGLLSAGIVAQAEAARYITVDVQAGLNFTATFDLDAVDPSGNVSAYGDGFLADINSNHLTIFGLPAGFIDFFAGVDLTGYDFSPSAFTYHNAKPNGGWSASYIYYIDQYEQYGATGGSAYNLRIVGTDAPQTVGIKVNGNLTPPAVPEPATWMMLVGGFGMVGSVMRGRRTMAVSFS
jgi:hypothetical protein